MNNTKICRTCLTCPTGSAGPVVISTYQIFYIYPIKCKLKCKQKVRGILNYDFNKEEKGRPIFFLLDKVLYAALNCVGVSSGSGFCFSSKKKFQ